LSEDLPIVVEIVDSREKLDKYLTSIEGSIQAGMVTLEKATIRFYRSNGK
jgi:PII-like signaling protein